MGAGEINYTGAKRFLASLLPPVLEAMRLNADALVENRN